MDLAKELIVIVIALIHGDGRGVVLALLAEDEFYHYNRHVHCVCTDGVNIENGGGGVN